MDFTEDEKKHVFYFDFCYSSRGVHGLLRFITLQGIIVNQPKTNDIYISIHGVKVG